MNSVQFAIVLIRLTGLGWLLEGLLLVTYIPTDLLGVGHFQSGYFATEHELDIVMKLFRIFLYIGIGLFFLKRAEAVARWATKGLERFSSPLAAERQVGIWPPAPRTEIEHPLTQPGKPSV